MPTLFQLYLNEFHALAVKATFDFPFSIFHFLRTSSPYFYQAVSIMTSLRIQKSPTRFLIHLVPGAAQDSILNIEDSSLRDTALVANGNFAEHYEIALYGSLATFARHLSLQDAATLLEQTLNEEKKVFEKSSIRRSRAVLAAHSRRCPSALAAG